MKKTSTVPKQTKTRKKVAPTVVVISNSEDNDIECLNPVGINNDIVLLDSDPQEQFNVAHKIDSNPSQCDLPGNSSDNSNLDPSQCDLPGNSGDNGDSYSSQHDLPENICDDIHFLPRNTTRQLSTSTTSSDSKDSTFDLYDHEMEQQNHANDLIQYMQALIDDNTSDKESETDDDPLQKMWSIFYRPSLSVEPEPPKRILQSGKSSYKHPLPIKYPSSKNLVPQSLPMQTKHFHNKIQLSAPCVVIHF